MSLPDKKSVLRSTPAQVRRLGRSAISQALSPLRLSGLVPRGLMALDEMLSLHQTHENLSSQVQLVEHDWPDPTIAVSPLRHKPRRVLSLFVLLDCQDGWRFDLGHLISPDNLIVAEPNIPFIDYPASLKRLTPSPHHLDGTVAYLSNTWPTNYSHWMLLVMPLIERYRQYLGADPDWYYVGEPLNSWQKEVLEKAGVSLETVVVEAVSADRLIAISAARYGRGIDPESLDYVRALYSGDREVQPTGTPSQSQPELVFLSRGKATTRQFLNEEDCFKALEPLGFQLVSTSGLSLADESFLFTRAKVIISCYGSALTNLIFAPAGVLVIELFPPGLCSDPNTVMSELTASIGGRYAALAGSEVPGNRKEIDLDLYVEPEALENLVRMALMIE